MDTLYYENNFNERIDLYELPYLFQSENLFNHQWSYEGENDGQRGGRITKFYRDITEFECELVIHAVTKKDFEQAMNQFFQVCEKDVLSGKPGKLVTDNDQYMICYILGNDKTEWSKGIKTSIDGLKIVSERPFWCKDHVHDFGNIADDGSSGGVWLDYPYDYPYDYMSQKVVQSISTNQIAILNSDLKITFEGAVENPYIEIGDNHYEIEASLSQNDLLVLDTRSRTIKIHRANGTIEDAFNARVKEYDNFAKIPAGHHGITTNARVEVTIYEERSEPLWSF